MSLRAGQWNVGLKGAPPPERAVPVPGDSTLYAAELWFMTATSYQLHVAVDGPSGPGTVIVPVLALATAERTMPPWLGTVLAALAMFLTAGLLTIISAALRESVLPPGVDPEPTETSCADRRCRDGGIRRADPVGRQPLVGRRSVELRSSVLYVRSHRPRASMLAGAAYADARHP